MEGSPRDPLDGNEQFTCITSLNCSPALTGIEAHVWTWNLTVEHSALAQLERLLSDDEWRRVRHLRSGQDARRFVVRRGVVRRILGLYLDLPPQNINFVYTEFGKPALRPGSYLHLHFNVSDSFELAALAVCASHPLGIDVERLRPYPSGAPMTSSYMTPPEIERLSRAGETERNRILFQAWTRFEAVAKAEGSGLRNLPRDLTRPGPASHRAQYFDPAQVSSNDRFRVADLSLPSGYVGALAAPPAIEKTVVFPVSWTNSLSKSLTA